MFQLLLVLGLVCVFGAVGMSRTADAAEPRSVDYGRAGIAPSLG